MTAQALAEKRQLLRREKAEALEERGEVRKWVDKGDRVKNVAVGSVWWESKLSSHAEGCFLKWGDVLWDGSSAPHLRTELEQRLPIFRGESLAQPPSLLSLP